MKNISETKREKKVDRAITIEGPGSVLNPLPGLVATGYPPVSQKE